MIIVIVGMIILPVIALLIIRNPFIGLILYVIFEYIKIGNVFPIIAKLHVSRALAILLFVSILMKYLKGNTFRIPVSLQNRAQLLFILAMAISTVLAFVQLRALEAFKVHLITAITYLFIVIIIKSLDKLKKFVWSFILIFLAVSVIGLHLYATTGLIDNLVIGGSISGADDVALGMSVALPFAYYLFIFEKGKFRYVAALIAVLLIITIILINARGGFLSLIGVTGLIYLSSPGKAKNLFLIFLGLFLVFLFAPPQFFSEFQSISAVHEGTAQNRLDLWWAGLKIFLDNPIFGVGPMNFPSVYGRFYLPADYYTQGWQVAHSDYITVLAEMGMFGFISFSLIVYLIIKDNLYIKRLMLKNNLKLSFQYMISNALLISLGGYLIGAVFLTAVYYPHLYIIAALTTALRGIVEKSFIKKEDQKSFPSRLITPR